MCFNGAKTWQLGWYSNYHLDMIASINVTVDLIGFAEKSNSLQHDKMIIRVQSTLDYEVYIHFNRKIGFNLNTIIGSNQILIATRNKESAYTPSYLNTQLDESGSFIIPNFDNHSHSLHITVLSIETSCKGKGSDTVP
jgi:hypothetical protein